MSAPPTCSGNDGTLREWYENIEPGIRPLVRLLRDNGWNTVCSCEHEMYVDVALLSMDDCERLASFLVENGYRKFHMAAELFAPLDGFWARRVHLTVGKFPI
jgi:hypothetical protein